MCAASQHKVEFFPSRTMTSRKDRKVGAVAFVKSGDETTREGASSHAFFFQINFLMALLDWKKESQIEFGLDRWIREFFWVLLLYIMQPLNSSCSSLSQLGEAVNVKAW